MHWRTGSFTHDLTSRGIVVGILNVTPDSFSDGGSFLDVPRAVEHALRMQDEGAAMIDIGGESTRPGAPGISLEEETRRVLPVIEGIMHAAPRAVLSIDTSKAVVAREALARGVTVVNDVTALRGDAAMAEIVANSGAGLVLMHMQGTPETMQVAPSYGDVVREVADFLAAQHRFAVAADIAPECIAFDPGIGFGKTEEHNLALLRRIGECAAPHRPVMVGVSRKGFLARWSGTQRIADRLAPTVALTALLRQAGVRIFRVHDVAANLAALRTAEALPAP